MPYANLREFITRLEGAGRLVRVKAPVSPFLEMTEIQTRLLAERGPAVLFENVVHPGIPAPDAGAGESVRHCRTGRLGHGSRAARVAGDRRDTGFPEAARTTRRLARSARNAAATQDRDGDAAAHRLGGAVPGNRAARHRHRPGALADPDLLARRAGAAYYLAAGRHQGSGHRARGQFQPRHLPHAGRPAATRP